MYNMYITSLHGRHVDIVCITHGMLDLAYSHICGPSRSRYPSGMWACRNPCTARSASASSCATAGLEAPISGKFPSRNVDVRWISHRKRRRFTIFCWFSKPKGSCASARHRPPPSPALDPCGPCKVTPCGRTRGSPSSSPDSAPVPRPSEAFKALEKAFNGL